MNIAKSHDVIDIRLMLLAVAERIPEKNNKINLIVLDLRADLLLSAQMSGEELVNIEIRDLFNQTSGCSGCIQLITTQYATVCNAEILHQFLF